jgi:hypothetical protein
MMNKTLKFILFAVLLFFSHFSFASDDKIENEPVISDDEIWIFLVDEPSGYMQDARESFLFGNTKDAALRIRKASAFLKLKSHRANKETAKALKVSAKELLKLAKSLEKGAVTATGTKLEDAFSRAEHALADHYFQLAKKYEADEEYEKSAFAIEAAVSHLLFASFWAEESLQEADIVAAKEARADVRKMTRDSEYKRKKIVEALKGIGRGIKKLSKKIKPFEPQDEEPGLR